MNSFNKNNIINAFLRSYSVRGNGKFQSSNTMRSAKFVFEISQELLKFSEKGNKLMVQNVTDQGEKSPGEWLFDICISDTSIISDKKGSAKVNSFLNWACESEYHTGLKQFSVDF